MIYKFLPLFLFSLFLVAPEELPNPKEYLPAPTLEDYEKNLEYYTGFCKEVFDFNSWNHVELKNTKTNKTVKFSELSEYEKNIFCVLMGDRLTREMTSTYQTWEGEQAKFKDKNYKPLAKTKINNAKENPALKVDIDKYLDTLMTLRKDHAQAYEKYIEKVFATYTKEIPEKEREHYLNQVKEYHDNNKLVERKKKEK